MRRFLRRVMVFVGALLLLVALAAAAIYVLSARRLNRVYDVNVVVPRVIPNDAADVERGHHIATALASCSMCHGADLGGQVLIDGPIGTLAGPNLTRGQGGLGETFTDADWVRLEGNSADTREDPLSLVPHRESLIRLPIPIPNRIPRSCSLMRDPGGIRDGERDQD